MTRAGPSIRLAAAEAAQSRGHPSPEVSRPYSARGGGERPSPGLPHPAVLRLPALVGRLTLRSPHHRAGPVSYRRHSWGSPFRGFPFRSPGTPLDTPLPLLAFLLSTVAVLRGRCRHPRTIGGGPSLLRSASPHAVRRRSPDRSGSGGSVVREDVAGLRACLQGFQPVSEVRTPVGGCYPARWEPILSWDFQPSRGFPLLASTTAIAASPLVRFVTACEQAAHGRFRVSIGGEVGWSLSRLPPLLGFLSSSREPSSGLRPSDGPGVGRVPSLPTRTAS
jgi:hypothetical protein